MTLALQPRDGRQKNMTLLIISSMIVAFIAGVAALFAPCCVTVLLPSYLASVFKEKYKVVLMTFVYFLGILTVFLPIGLGVSAMAMAFKQYHGPIFIAGGLFLGWLGISILLDKKFSLPFHFSPRVKIKGTSSVFATGIFSGIATTCCAPVLAGVLALAALPGSIFWGGMYTLMYVFGMVTPLFIIAFFLDKIDFKKKISFANKSFSYVFLGKQITISISDLISGAMFLGLGILIVYLAFANKLAVHSDYQLSINLYFAKMTNRINEFLKIFLSF